MSADTRAALVALADKWCEEALGVDVMGYSQQADRMRDCAQELREAADQFAAPVGWCHWTEDENGAWQTACGHTFEFNDGGPVENEQQFCGYCGLRLHEVPHAD